MRFNYDMESKIVRLFNILLCYFRKGKNATQDATKLRDACGEKTLQGWQYTNWFDKICSSDYSLKDERRTDKSKDVTDDLSPPIIENYSKHSTH